MAVVTVTMNMNIQSLFNLYNQVGITIPNINASLGSIITHTVTGGTLTKDQDHPNDSTKDTINVNRNDTIIWKFQATNLPPNPPAASAMLCTFVNMDVQTKSVTAILNSISQGNDLGTAGQKQLTATANFVSVDTTNNYAITFTINGHQLTFDPKIRVKTNSPIDPA
jgi:hypothetical protein